MTIRTHGSLWQISIASRVVGARRNVDQQAAVGDRTPSQADAVNHLSLSLGQQAVQQVLALQHDGRPLPVWVRALDAPIFVKPLSQHKEFTGHVRRGDLDDLNRTAHLEDDFDVLVSDVVDFVSEWRCFVLRGQCIGAKPYAGDVRAISPDWRVLDGAIGALGDALPAGCSIDLGVTRTGETLVVEMNDGYALGSYGLAAVPYAQLLEARWEELMR